MYKDLKFPVLIVHRDIKADTVAGERVRGIAHELEQDGFSILSTASSAEGRIVASTHHGLACILVAAEGAGENQRLLQDVVELIRVARVRAPQLPIFALGEQVTIENAPAESMADLHQLRGILYLFEDTVPFLARQVARAARNYLAGLLPPFFRALVEHTAQSNYSWHTPGHGGGVAYRKSPVGQAFHQFFGENTLRSDLSVSVPELGSLLDHTGPLAEAEDRAARNFGADHTFFVINGTSTANKIVWHSMVGREDLVLVDRNCHKSILHSIIMTGAIPLYLTPERNELGIIGPIPLSEFSKQSIAAKIAASPLARGREPKVKLAVVTNSTYDGLCYNAELIKQTLGDSVEVLHFDEAWYAYAAFHEFYDGRYGMGTSRSEEGPLVFATHSTHKMLAAFSQASMIHVQDGGTRKLDVARFNEAFMMHISTSPQYGIIASLDVASAMMEGPAGRSLIQETFDEALSFRRALANVRQNLDRNAGMFCFQAATVLQELERHAPEVLIAARAALADGSSLENGQCRQRELAAGAFAEAPDISVDYALMERSDKVAVVPCSIGWSDIGSWQALRELSAADENGNQVRGESVLHDVSNCYIDSPKRLVGAVGVHDLIIVDTPDALLVADAARSQDVKFVAQELKRRGHDAFRLHRTVSRPWGTYTVLEEGRRFKIKRIVVRPKASLSLQMHHHRSEHWIVVSGMALVENGEREFLLNTNESTFIPAGHSHRLSNPGIIDLVMIEVQSGEYLGEDDIVRFNDIYGRAPASDEKKA